MNISKSEISNPENYFLDCWIRFVEIKIIDISAKAASIDRIFFMISLNTSETKCMTTFPGSGVD